MTYATLPSNASSNIAPYTISAPQEKLDELKTLIKLAKIAPKTYESTHADTKNDKYGVEYDWLVHARDEWLNLDWKKTENYLNSFPQFMTKIEHDGGSWNIHFTALFSKKNDAVPLLYLHGWPGNILEFLPTLELLKKKYTPETLPYHVIVPSLPGYALSSGPPVDREPDTKDMSSIMDALMQQLGFGSGYIAQGGDVGSGVARMLGRYFDSCKAVHVNVLFLREKPDGAPEVKELSEVDQQGMARGQEFFATGTGYMMMHSTRPSTIGFVLQSSPIALLSWVGEKYVCWSDETPSLQHILESITLYWVTDCAARCIWSYRMRPKYEPFNKPLGFSSFPRELFVAPESWAAKMGDLVFYRRHEKGGHFAALEEPEVLLEDVEEFIKQVWKK